MKVPDGRLVVWAVTLSIAGLACTSEGELPVVDGGRRDLGFVFPDVGPWPDASFGPDAHFGPDAGFGPDSNFGEDAQEPPDLPRDAGPPGVCGAARAPTAGDLLVNEFLADPGPDLENGDANADGTRSATDDEFIELANIAQDDLLLEGVTVQDAAGTTRHIFGAVTLGCGQVIVIFGGGDEQAGDWSTNWVVASSGGLSLNNDADEIRLGLEGGAADELGVTSYGSEANVDQSLVLDPDLDDNADFVEHSLATGSNGAAFSPGTRIDGSEF